MNYTYPVDLLLRIIEILGICAFCLSGIATARAKNMDIVGVYFVSLITSFGGGTIRDVLLDRRPLFWIEHWQYPLMMLALSLAAMLLKPRTLERPAMQSMAIILDALGLGLFSAGGAILSLHLGCHFFIALLMGVITGIFGGVLRDMVCNDIPAVFRQRTELYATCVAAGCLCCLLLDKAGAPALACLLTGIIITAAMRLAAVKFKIFLPI